jgi:chitodextrinase
MSTRVAAHELGHNYGAHHASTISCTANGVRVTYSNTCTQSEYGDPFDVMGTGTRLNWAWHRKQMTLMPSTDIVTVTGGTHTLLPVATGGSPKSLRIARPDGNYWYVEYRVPFGAYDNFTAGAAPTNGVLIRLAPSTSRVQSNLVDATPSTTTFSDAAFTPGTTFVDDINNIRIRVDSVDGSSAVVTFNPTSGDTQAPTAPGSFAAAQASSSSINLTWTASSDNVGVTGYEIRRDGALIASPGASATSFLDTGRSAGTTYNYSIVARDAAGNTSTAATTSGFIQGSTQDTSAPSAPTSLTGSVANGFRVTLRWGASTDNIGVTGYRIYANGSQVATSSGTTTTFKSTKGTKTFTVRAVDAAGNLSAPSNGLTLNP